jgi:hypothetical protein
MLRILLDGRPVAFDKAKPEDVRSFEDHAIRAYLDRAIDLHLPDDDEEIDDRYLREAKKTHQPTRNGRVIIDEPGLVSGCHALRENPPDRVKPANVVILVGNQNAAVGREQAAIINKRILNRLRETGERT